MRRRGRIEIFCENFIEDKAVCLFGRGAPSAVVGEAQLQSEAGLLPSPAQMAGVCPSSWDQNRRVVAVDYVLSRSASDTRVHAEFTFQVRGGPARIDAPIAWAAPFDDQGCPRHDRQIGFGQGAKARKRSRVGLITSCRGESDGPHQERAGQSDQRSTMHPRARFSLCHTPPALHRLEVVNGNCNQLLRGTFRAHDRVGLDAPRGRRGHAASRCCRKREGAPAVAAGPPERPT